LISIAQTLFAFNPHPTNLIVRGVWAIMWVFYFERTDHVDAQKFKTAPQKE
jgi:hypothetical protein